MILRIRSGWYYSSSAAIAESRSSFYLLPPTMDVINAMFLSTAVGAFLALPAVVSEFLRRGKNLPLLLDVRACWGRVCTAEETFVLSLFTHFLLSMAFGGLYMFAVLSGWLFHDFQLGSIVTYAVIFWLFIGVVIFPLVRLGFFGQREGRWAWLELLASTFLEAIGFWAALRLFPVFLPS